MIIRSDMSELTIPYKKPFTKSFGRGNPLRDMKDLFGGQIRKTASGIPYFEATSGKIGATVKPLKPKEAAVNIGKLDNSESAKAWTAMQAYRQKGALALGLLVAEVPGLRGQQEWEARRLQKMSQQIEQERDAYRPDMENFVARTASEAGASDAEFMKNFMGIYRASRERAVDLDEHDWLLRQAPQNLPPTHTLFFARGDTLSAAAHIMADNYGELTFHANDANTTVAEALGTSSLDRLDHVLDTAMAQPSPLQAARFVLHNL